MRTQIGLSLQTLIGSHSLTLTDSNLPKLIDWHLLMQTHLSSLTLTDSS